MRQTVAMAGFVAAMAVVSAIDAIGRAVDTLDPTAAAVGLVALGLAAAAVALLGGRDD